MNLQKDALPRRWPDDALRESGATVALCLVAIAAFYLHTRHLPRAPVDDAGISVAYARTLAEGAGLRLTPASAAAEGFSNPSWTFLLAFVELLGGDSVAWLAPLSTAFCAATLLLLACWGPVAERRRFQLEDAIAPWIAAAHPSFVHWAQGGLEIGLQLFCIALLGLLGFGSHNKRTATGFGITAAVLILSRPEAPIYAAAISLAWLGMLLVERRWPGKLELRALAWSCLPPLAYLLFRRWYFGEWLPNTYFAKRGWDFGAEAYLQSFYDSYRWLITLTCWLGVAGMLRGARTRVRAVTAAACTLALAYFAWYARGDWMMEWRFLAPVAPFQGAMMAAGVSGLRNLASLSERSERARPYAARIALGVASACVLGLAYSVLPMELARSADIKARGSDIAITLARDAFYQPIHDAIVAAGMSHPLIVASDMGVAGIGLRSAELWDFAGLTDPALSRQFRGGPGLDYRVLASDYFEHEGLPSFALSWGPGAFFPGTKLGALYEPFGPGFFRLRGLGPASDERCPEPKLTVLSMSADALLASIERDAEAGEPVRALARYRCAATYLPDRKLPARAARSQLADRIEALAQRAAEQGKQELSLRHYSLCAVLALDAHTSVACRREAEHTRLALFPADTVR
ncbi:MAG: hypothetical protein JWN04_4461 [Myxococcaceae bacterium]|nr:hypothetical protein [Myxococcaceae bacterium]